VLYVVRAIGWVVFGAIVLAGLMVFAYGYKSFPHGEQRADYIVQCEQRLASLPAHLRDPNADCVNGYLPYDYARDTSAKQMLWGSGLMALLSLWYWLRNRRRFNRQYERAQHG
jgi:hypothetical protein